MKTNNLNIIQKAIAVVLLGLLLIACSVVLVISSPGTTVDHDVDPKLEPHPTISVNDSIE